MWFFLLLLGCVLLQYLMLRVGVMPGLTPPLDSHPAVGVVTVLVAEVALVLVRRVVRAAGRGELFRPEIARCIDVIRWLVLPLVGLPTLVILHLFHVRSQSDVPQGSADLALLLFVLIVSGGTLFSLLNLARDVYREPGD